MIWYKTWLDTRSRFLIGLLLLAVSAGGLVFEYQQVQRVLPFAGNVSSGVQDGFLRRAIDESLELSHTFRGYVWSQWFRQNALTIGSLFAALLGSGSLFTGAGRGALFTLALPVSRRRWLGVRAVTGFAELFLLLMLPSLAIAALAPAVGERYGFGEAAVHALCALVGVTAFFSLTMLLSTVFNDIWRPILLVCVGAVGLSLSDPWIPGGLSIFRVISAEEYFRGGSLPWGGLLACALATAAMLYAAAKNLERRDF